jgi:hypothetical protein
MAFPCRENDRLTGAPWFAFPNRLESRELRFILNDDPDDMVEEINKFLRDPRLAEPIRRRAEQLRRKRLTKTDETHLHFVADFVEVGG